MRFPLLLLCLLLGLAPASADERWDEYQLVMWQDMTAAQLSGLRALNFTGTKLRASQGTVDQDGQAMRLSAGLPWYLENLATDFYAPYHRYTPGKPVTWLFDEAKAAYRRGSPGAFERVPSLSDSAWLDRVQARLRNVVSAEKQWRPLFYNLADEAGIADVAAAWDFDTSAASLAGMRDWLHTIYPSLGALNEQWGTAFADWTDVRPELTDAALRRPDHNFSAWSDFKAWMDVAFARAVQAGRNAVHGADPAALVALEGAQVPGWGGYDYSQLAPALDVMEIYDFGDALDLALAFNPALIPLRTSFGRGPREAHEAWHSLLHGVRGTVVWDEANDVVQLDGNPGPRGRELSELWRAMRPVADQLRRLQPAADPVAVLYSPSSFRVQWLLDRRAGDHDWESRDAEREYDDNPTRASRRILLQRLAQIAVQPRLVDGTMLASLWQGGTRVLFLPHAIALAEEEVAAIRAFRRSGGTVLADVAPGIYDGHGRRRAVPPLPEIAMPEAVRPLGNESNPTLLTALRDLVTQAGARPRATLTGPDGALATGVETRWFEGEGVTILSLHAGRPWGAPARLSVELARSGAISLLREPDRPVDKLVELDGIEPTLLVIR